MKRPELGRYVDCGVIGAGASGSVHRVQDPQLDRTVAMKVLDDAAATEARVMARLQHPGVVPVHELGALPDGRAYFTMREVQGRTLAEVIAAVHAASSAGWGAAPDGWTLHRLVSALQRVCETVAYAHSQGVVHGDVKPANIMVGDFGEVLVLDWGLARGSDGDAVVSGTPAYMAPEQARGRPVPASDVFSLGASLFEILTGGPPIEPGPTAEVLHRARHGVHRPLLGPGPIPDELADTCEQALAVEPERRHRGAAELAADLAAWLEGARRRAQAGALVTRADALRPAIVALQDRARVERDRAAALRAEVPDHAPEHDKWPAWHHEEEAARLDTQARLQGAEYTRTLHAAIQVADLPEAHERLASWYRALHLAAERARDVARAAELEATLRSHDRRGTHATYLEGKGPLELDTDPVGAHATLFRLVERRRRLVEVDGRELGPAPVRIDLPIGSYLVVLRAEGHSEVRLPVVIGRDRPWRNVPPGASDPWPVWLPPLGTLDHDECYVAGGWFDSGGDPEALDGLLSRRLWVDGFAVSRFSVSHARYQAWLNALSAAGEVDEAWRRVPAVQDVDDVRQHGLYRLGDAGFELRSDAGLALGPDSPVMRLDWYAASAFAAAHGRRLLHDQEWEKAARGCDGRWYPWGDAFDPSFCNMQASHGDVPTILPNDAFPADVSVYGVRGLAGQVRDWCANDYESGTPPGSTVQQEVANGPHRMIRGGCFAASPALCRAAARFASVPERRVTLVGLRTGRSVGPQVSWPRR